MNKNVLLLIAITLPSVFLSACTDTIAPVTSAPPPIVQGKQIRFAPNHPQLALLGISDATDSPSISLELPAKLIWNEERTQRIYASFAGRVLKIRADVGQAVEKGQELAVLSSPEFGLAQSETIKSEVEMRLAKSTLARQKELFDAGIIAKKDLEVAEADAARSVADSSQKQARTKLYGSTEGINQELRLLSTIRGKVVERNLNPGQEIRPDQSGVGVPPLFVISDPKHLWVQVDAREADIDSLRPGGSFDISVPSLGGQRFKAVVEAASDAIDPNTRTIKIRGLVINAEQRLKAEMLVTAHIKRVMTANAVSIPASAALLYGARHQVFVQTGAGVFEPREVELGYEGTKDVVVVKGLQPGEEVVSENTLLLARLWRLSRDNPATTKAEQNTEQGKSNPIRVPAPQ
jgi:cobalt-zinc-cadmium efflux system membrane fusion protein